MRYALCILVALSSPAVAAWEVSRSTSPMTDRTSAVATLRDTAQQAALVVTCAGPDLVFNAPLQLSKIGVNYRWDADTFQSRIASMNSEGTTPWVWIGSERAALSRLARSKRLRMELLPLARPVIFLDFDTTGAREAIAALGCKS